MQAEVKSIVSPDILSFKDYYPEDDICFSFLLQVVVGAKGEQGGDTFNIEVCTPQWLLHNYKPETLLFARGKMIVFEYNFDRIIKRIVDYCDSSMGDTWQEIVNRISRIAIWEFEDYH